MEILFIVLPLALLLAGGALTAFFWAVHRGQLDDLDTPAYRVIFDQEHPRKDPHAGESSGSDPTFTDSERD
ncbi:MAG: hypothetical protein KatS3mg104_1405 [Phycisphaerae bacterium]|nr:MAG: hypothetical protein KatS3mg104_1405 [Phycisphaerae bacterium]